MVQFLSIIFFLGFLQFLLGFSKVPFFCVTLFNITYIKTVLTDVFGTDIVDSILSVSLFHKALNIFTLVP